MDKILRRSVFGAAQNLIKKESLYFGNVLKDEGLYEGKEKINKTKTTP